MHKVPVATAVEYIVQGGDGAERVVCVVRCVLRWWWWAMSLVEGEGDAFVQCSS